MAKHKRTRKRGSSIMRGFGGMLPNPKEVIMPVAGGAVYNLAVGASAKFIGAGQTLDSVIGAFGAWFIGKKVMNSNDFALGALGALGSDLATSFGLRSMVGLGDYLSDYLRDGVAAGDTVQFHLPDGSRAMSHVADVGTRSGLAAVGYKDSD